ncbi:MAG: hypothetical protein HC899_34680, partial [Leptolyngbyaceae cyanobacterium SM1_4_3]|nr:hypothetical protein [Leptolyngbyaceae cyanobacterium SM1_4_3]
MLAEQRLHNLAIPPHRQPPEASRLTPDRLSPPPSPLSPERLATPPLASNNGHNRPSPERSAL